MRPRRPHRDRGSSGPAGSHARSLLRVAGVLLLLSALGLTALGGLGRVGGAACVGLGLMAWLLGVRHAFDADHIAAIDNVTRRLRQQGRRPVAVGLFFSLGHSTVVVGLTLLLALGLRTVDGAAPWLASWGTPLSLVASAAFLSVLAVLNLRSLLALRARGAPQPAAHFERVRDSRSMFPLGLLFGLNLDTAGEVVLLAASAAAIPAVSLPWWAVMSFPLLFMAGMALADTGEGLLMLRLYDWAIADRDRTLRLNSCTVALSVVLAGAVAAVQWSALAHWAGLSAGPAALLIPSATLGAMVTVFMALLWAAARLRRLQGPAALTAGTVPR